MALPSQSGRVTPSARSHMSRRRKSRVGILARWVVVAAVVAGLGWLGLTYWPGGPREAQADPTHVDRGEPARASGPAPAATETTSPASSSTQTPTEPLVRISMDQGVIEKPSPEPPRKETAPAVQPTGGDHPALANAEALLRENNLIGARDVLNAALFDPGTSEGVKANIRTRMQAINDDLLFSPKVYAKEPHTKAYVVAGGDSLVRITSREQLRTHPKLIARVNRLARPDVIFEGQRLKLVNGPFHAVVHKGAYRLDLYIGPAGEPQSWTYVRSFRVGLGEGDSTPIGEFIVRRNSKLENPAWVNPRTGEKFDANDPRNPIGEHWIGLDGVGEFAVHTGYGLHGTIEPDSVGQMRSMGCVRMLGPDIEFVYELMEEGVSHVSIRP